MVMLYTQFFPVRVEYTSDNDHIYVIDEAGKLRKCWIASPLISDSLKTRMSTISKPCMSLMA